MNTWKIVWCILYAWLFCIPDHVKVSVAIKEIILGRDNTDTIHRFFDSSPFSHHEDSVILTELPRNLDNEDALPFANITMVHFSKNSSDDISYKLIDRTLAWGAQLGAQIQVIGDRIFYNVLEFDPNKCRKRADFMFSGSQNSGSSLSACHLSIKVHGRVYDLMSSRMIDLPCPIYHVSSNGKYTSAVNLFHIQHAQKGYGIDWLGIPPKEFALLHEQNGENGVLINDVEHLTCSTLYTLREIANYLHINHTIYSNRILGFHTKWSSDNKWIMFVLRTLETPTTAGSNGRVRVQHLLALKFPQKRTADQILEKKEIRYLLSWASKPFLPLSSSGDIASNVRLLCDGNHPNWKPKSHIITMNLQMPVELPSQSDVALPSSWWSQLTSSVYNAVTSVVAVNLFGDVNTGAVDRGQWYTVAIDIDLAPANLSLYHRSIRLVPKLTAAASSLGHNHVALPVQIITPIGLGHPSFSPSNDYIVTDTYPKEIYHVHQRYPTFWKNEKLNESVENQPRQISLLGAVHVPILLFHAAESQSDYNLIPVLKLTDVPVAAAYGSSRLSGMLRSTSSGAMDLVFRNSENSPNNRAEHAWRCDAHPAWSPSGRYLALNILNVSTNTRQVMILSLPESSSSHSQFHIN